MALGLSTTFSGPEDSPRSDAGQASLTVIFCTQYFACATPERQQEIDRCLRLNLSNRLFERAVIWLEPQAPAPPSSLIPIEIIPLDRRLTYSDWLHVVQCHAGQIFVLANSDISFDASVGQLQHWLLSPRSALALSRHEPGLRGEAVLRPHPHWSQDVWALRGDAPIDSSLLSASVLPLGVAGCDNRFAHALWTHGFRLVNPCQQIRALHHQRLGPNAYDQDRQRLFGACTYVHPGLTPAEPSALEHVIWSRSPLPEGALTLQLEGEQIATEHYLRQPDGVSVAHSWSALSAGLLMEGRPISSQRIRAWGPGAATGACEASPLQLPLFSDRLLLPVALLQRGGLRLELMDATPLRALCLRLPGRMADRSIAVEAMSRDSGWFHWRPIQPPDAPAMARKSVQILVPGRADRVQQLRLRWPERSAAEPAAGMEPRADMAELFELILIAPSEERAPSRAMPPPVEEISAGDAALILPPEAQVLLPRLPQIRTGLLAWDPADPTEELAWQQHQLDAPTYQALDPFQAYLGLPWSSFAARGRAPSQLIASVGHGYRMAAAQMAQGGRQLRVHSVCQHRAWRDQLPLFERAGITDLWLSHKPQGVDRIGSLSLHPWPSLCPRDPHQPLPTSALLCQGGMAWRPEDFWQCLGAGVTVVLLPPWPELPRLPVQDTAGLQGWDEVVLFWPDGEAAGLERWLAHHPAEDILRRSARGRQLVSLYSRASCLQWVCDPG